MNKYRDKSDFEINKAVVIALGKVIGIRPDSNIIYLIGGDELIEFNPCNNPADAMPIINEYGISLIYQEGEFQFATNDGNIECSISNPLKAAMIIFLMMKDAENEKV
ncbi:phage protein NinX family protein [Morganella sp. Je.2.23]|uniref:phage protein NinX family protein n=1 Tax=Morganella sp. Je.2.23 TaxID=3142840 RepID=UPI003DA81832